MNKVRNLPGLIVLAALIFAICWIVFWGLHDYIATLLPKVLFVVPRALVGIIYAGGGYVIGRLLGYPLALDGLAPNLTGKLVALAIILTGACLGEYGYGTILGSLLTGELSMATWGHYFSLRFYPHDTVGVLGAIFSLLLRSLTLVGGVAGILYGLARFPGNSGASQKPAHSSS